MPTSFNRRRYGTCACTTAWLLALFAIAIAEDKPKPKFSPLDRLEGRPGDVVASLSTAGFVDALVFSPDGKWLASSDSNENVVIRDTANFQKPVVVRAGPNLTLLELLWSEGTSIYCLAFSPDSKVLALVLGSRSIELWDVCGAKPTKNTTIHLEKPFADFVAFSPDGKTLAITGGPGPAVRLWDLGGDKPKQRATLGQVTLSGANLAFAPDGKHLAVASAESTGRLLAPLAGAVTVFDLTTEKERARIEGLKGEANCVAYSTDGHTLAVTSVPSGRDVTPNLRLYDLRGHQPKERVLVGHQQELQVTFVGFIADGKTLLSAGWDGRVILWDVATGKMIRQVCQFSAGIYHAALAPDGRHLAAGFRDGNIHIVRLR